MEMQHGTDGIPGGDIVSQQHNPPERKVMLGMREVMHALAWDQFTTPHLLNNNTIHVLSRHYEDTYRGALQELLRLASLEKAPKLSPRKNKIGQVRVSELCLGWIWYRLHHILELRIVGLKFDLHLQALFDAFERNGFFDPDGLISVFDPNYVDQTTLDLLNKVIAELHKTFTSKAFTRKVQDQQRARERTKAMLLEVLDFVRASTSGCFVFRMDLQYLHDAAIDKFAPLTPTKEGCDKFRADVGKFLDIIRGRSKYKRNYVYIRKITFGSYRGWNSHLIFFFNPEVVCDLEAVESEFKDIWKRVAGDKGLAYSTVDDVNKFKSNAIGMIHKEDSHKWASLMDTIEYFSIADQLLVTRQISRYHSIDHSEVVSWDATEKKKTERKRRVQSIFTPGEDFKALPRYQKPPKKGQKAKDGSAIDIPKLHEQREEMALLGMRVQVANSKHAVRKEKEVKTKRIKYSLDETSRRNTAAAFNAMYSPIERPEDADTHSTGSLDGGSGSGVGDVPLAPVVTMIALADTLKPSGETTSTREQGEEPVDDPNVNN